MPTLAIHLACDGRDRGLDLVGGVVAAEPEADALAAHVGDDVRAREPIVQRLRAGELEGEEMTAPGPDRDRRDQPGIGQRPHLGARDRRKKQILQRQHVVVDRTDGQSDLVHPVEHGGLPIEPGRIERRAHEAGAISAVGDGAVALAAERAEGGEPSGVARPHGKARRAMHEADAFARHRVFVAAGEIERATGADRQRGRHRHEAVIAVEHDQRVVVTDRARRYRRADRWLRPN